MTTFRKLPTRSPKMAAITAAGTVAGGEKRKRSWSMVRFRRPGASRAGSDCRRGVSVPHPLETRAYTTTPGLQAAAPLLCATGALSYNRRSCPGALRETAENMAKARQDGSTGDSAQRRLQMADIA